MCQKLLGFVAATYKEGEFLFGPTDDASLIRERANCRLIKTSVVLILAFLL